MITRIRETIKRHKLIEKGDRVVVGVSGGPDSVCLLHVLQSLSTELNLSLTAVHINHMLRGDESDGDQRYVEELCKKLDIPLFICPFDIEAIAGERGISLEEAGREVRYGEFDRISGITGAKKIAVAHNKNDQAETVLMHIIRGTGLDGLKGMDYKRGRIIRPLLDIARKDIEQYCLDNNLNPRIDSSNLVNIYTRNKVRLDLIPYVNTLFGMDLTENLVKMSSLLKDDSDFIDDTVSGIYDKNIIKRDSDEIWLELGAFKQSHSAVQKRVIRNAIREVKGDLKGIESIHIAAVIELALYGGTGKHIHLPSDIRAGKSYDVLKIFAEHPDFNAINCDKAINIPGTTIIDGIDAAITAYVEERGGNSVYQNESSSTVQFFDYEKLKSGINIRKRKEGDIFKPLRSSGTKKLKEYFIDSKIPRELRERIPVIAKGNEIVWVIGYKISDKFKVTENTKSILRLEFNDPVESKKKQAHSSST